VTDPGTVATKGLVETSGITNPPAGAFAERLTATFCVTAPLRINVEGVNERVAPTITAWVPVVKPAAVAVIFDDPKLTPVTCG
jgi:hypothetical protein